MPRTGRPKKDTEPLTVRLPVGVLARIDEIRRAAPDLPSRPEVVRRLIEKALLADDETTQEKPGL